MQGKADDLIGNPDADVDLAGFHAHRGFETVTLYRWFNFMAVQ
jgi:hypothetical protein